MAQIEILLALFQGATHVQEQLESYAAQTFTDWSLIVSDDGSTDGGPDMVRAFGARHPLRLINGPKRGAAANFLHLLLNVSRDVPFVALSDQDDVWLPGKLAQALEAIGPTMGPVLYSARTLVTGPALEPRKISAQFSRPFGFRNALVQNIAAGNTIVLNRAALDIAQAAAQRVLDAGADVVVHDWWLYQLISGAGGTILRDDRPVLHYRQHGANVIGDSQGWQAIDQRFRRLFRGEFRHWLDVQLTALTITADMLTPEAHQILNDFIRLRRARLLHRLAGLARLRLYRQSRAGTCILWLAAMTGRM